VFELDFTITNLEQLDDYQQFINEYGLCQVINVYKDPDFTCFGTCLDEDNLVSCSCGYEYEIVDAYDDYKEIEGNIFILEIGDKIRLS
jgi:hypothetical protein